MGRAAGTSRFQFRGRVSAFAALLGACALYSLPWPALAQSSTADSRVLQLYGEAKSDEAQGNISGAVAKYKSILEISPRLAPAYNNLGALYVRQRDFADAIPVLEKGLQIDPKMTSATALLGVSLYETGDFAGARPRLEAALRANPGDANLEMTLVNALVKLGDLESAASHLQGIVHRDPKNQEAWYRLGTLYMQLSQEALTKLQEIDPNSMLVHEVSGEIMQSMNNYDGAILEFKKAAEMAPRTPGTHYKLGDAYWAISQWDAATREFQAELENDPRNCSAEWKLGDIILEQHGDSQQALDDVNKALAICPDLTESHLDRARALLRLDKAGDAVPDLEIAVRAAPDDPNVHFLLAQAYRSLGQTEKAKAELQVFSKLEAAARAKTASRAQQVMQEAQPQQQQPPKD